MTVVKVLVRCLPRRRRRKAAAGPFPKDFGDSTMSAFASFSASEAIVSVGIKKDRPLLERLARFRLALSRQQRQRDSK